MAFNFFPKSAKFYELFLKQNNLIKDASSILEQILVDRNEIAAKCEKINKLESDGNILSREIAMKLAATFITPIDREDIHSLNVAQEDILNVLKAIASRFGMYRFEKSKKSAIELMHDLNEIICQTELMIEHLSHKKPVTDILKLLEININEAQLLFSIALTELYEKDVENNKDIINIIKWTQIYEWIQDALNKLITLTNMIERISLKDV